LDIINKENNCNTSRNVVILYNTIDGRLGIHSMQKQTHENIEVEAVDQVIRSLYFTRIATFADTVDRYIDIELKDSINWLKTFALIQLVLRGGSLTPSELAKLMLRSNHSMTKLIDGLVKEGLVRRHRNGKDRRIIQVKITQEGLAEMLKIVREVQTAENTVESCLDENELEQLGSLIRKLRYRLIERIAAKTQG
jgi:DNA-binding MarR family transcriptional regulator